MNMNKAWRQAKSGRFRFIVQSHQTKEVFPWRNTFEMTILSSIWSASHSRCQSRHSTWEDCGLQSFCSSASEQREGLTCLTLFDYWRWQSATGSLFGQDVLLRFQMHNYGIAARVQLQLQGNHAVLPRRSRNLSLHTRGCCLVRWVLMIWTLCMQR